MTVPGTQQVMDGYLRALLGDGDYKQHFTDDVRFSVLPADQHVQGRDAVAEYIDGLHHVAFRADPELVSLVAGEDHAVAELVFVGTHVGEFAGVPATGNEVRLPYSVVYDLRDGKISALRAYLSVTDLVDQLSPAPAAADS